MLIKEPTKHIWYCKNCGHKNDVKFSLSKDPKIMFYKKCNHCKKYFDIDNKEIKI